MAAGTLVLTRSDIAALLGMHDCIDAVETAFRLHAGGKIGPPGILGMHVADGSFHVKAAGLSSYFAAKTNANFPGNAKAAGLPTIQGAILLFDAGNGRLLAIMDSAEVTALRTGATTGVAARHLANRSASTDSLEQCAQTGDLHHALDAGTIGRGGVHASLGEVVAGHKQGRESESEIILFDSTGVALGDVAAAALIYERAVANGHRTSVQLTA
jgi:ornithine cyclodeaminase/alanine dehydrogenase-like protein (mu-crystallin family)